MKTTRLSLACLTVLAAALAAPAYGTVTISSLTPAVKAPQVLGTSIRWRVTATDSHPGPLAFQFSVAVPLQPPVMVQDFNPGTYRAGAWNSIFTWVPTAVEGFYHIQVVVKDFASGESATLTAQYQVNPLVTRGAPVVAATGNPLVALFSAPSCAAGSSVRVMFQDAAKSHPATATNYQSCHPPASVNFEIAGMYPSTSYTMFAQTMTAGTIKNGPSVAFMTGALPSGLAYPPFKVLTPAGPQTDTTDDIILINPTPFGGTTHYVMAATDLSGKILWYYTPSPWLTRPLQNGTLLTIQDSPSWYPGQNRFQFLRQVDLAGNTIKETNVGAIAQQLLALGATDGQLCTAVSSPAPVGAACVGGFHHDAVQTLPNGQTAVFLSVEKIFAPGTQGSTSPYPVDIIGDFIVVLDTNWQVVWYFDTFQHDGGPPQLDITRPALGGETCTPNVQGCPPVFLLGPGIAPAAFDWLHANSIYYWPQEHDLIWSARDQDWVMKVDYNDGAGTGNILWRMGKNGDFYFHNIYNDPWPWFSHQHEAALENSGAGPLTLFDNGDTRVTSQGGNSRCMALTMNESAKQVTPVLSQDAGAYSPADGSIQLLANGNYYCFNPLVLVNLSTEDSYSLEYVPTAGTATGTNVLDVQGPDGYRGFRMPNLYNPPIS